MENVSAMEVNLVRPFARRALEAFYKHDKPEVVADRNTRSSRQPREANDEPRVKPFTLPTHFPFFSLLRKKYTNLELMFYRDL